MEVVYYAARANLRRLMRLYPQWTQPQYAQAVGMSLGWVKKGKKRLQEAEPEDEQVLHSRSRARKHPPEPLAEQVVERIIEMRDEPPEGLRRTPGRHPPSSPICPGMSRCKASGSRARAGRSTAS
jgi:hypothetical protein